MENIEQIPSAEGILDKWVVWNDNLAFIADKIFFLKAMEEYASLKVEEERKKHEQENKNLNKALDEQVEMTSNYRLRYESSEEEVKQTNYKLGSRIYDLLDENKQQQSRIEELTKALEWKDRIIARPQRKYKRQRDYIHLYPNCDVQTPTRHYSANGGKSFKVIGRVMCIDYVIEQVGVHISGNRIEDLVNYPFDSIKLILRKPSDITEEERLDRGKAIINLGKQYIDAEYQRWMLSKGFDLFGLIESGLAIDKSTLKENGK